MLQHDLSKLTLFEETVSLGIILKSKFDIFRANLFITKTNSDCFLARRNRYLDFLCDEELKIYNSAHTEQGRSTYLAGRIAAKKAISKLLDIDDLVNVKILRGVFDHPIVNYLPYANIQVSISHTNNYAGAIAFYEHCPMALDIEEVTQQKLIDVKTQLTKKEISELLIDEKFAVALWTSKEAISKVLKTGLQCDFMLYEIDKIKEYKNNIVSNFVNFPQYQSYSFFFNNEAVLSIVFPEMLEPVINI